MMYHDFYSANSLFAITTMFIAFAMVLYHMCIFIYSAYKIKNTPTKWISVKDRPLTVNDGEVIAYHKSWEDEDFNPLGTRAGFTYDEGKFISAKWCGFSYHYESCAECFPTHYYIIPKR